MEHLRDPPDDPGKVAEQDAEVGARVRQLVRRRGARRVGQRVDADDLDARAAQLDLDRARRRAA